MTHVDPEAAVQVVLRARLRSRAQGEARRLLVQRHYEEYRRLYEETLVQLRAEVEEAPET